VVTKDFTRNETYLQRVTPYVADRQDNYQFYPLFKPERDNLDFKWRKVNKEPFLLKKYSKFPRPLKETYFDDTQREQYVQAREAVMESTGKSTGSRSPSPGSRRIAPNYENQKPAEEIFQSKLKYDQMDNLDNFELAQMKLKEDTYYVPPESKYQAPHPMSQTRCAFVDDPTVNMKRVLKLRAQGGAVIPTSRSLTNVPLAAEPEKCVEFRSVKQLHKCRKKHMRSTTDPFQKYSGVMTLGSQTIGWAQSNPTITTHYKRPAHGIADSEVTAFYSNMKATNMEAILRYEG